MGQGVGAAVELGVGQLLRTAGHGHRRGRGARALGNPLVQAVLDRVVGHGLVPVINRRLVLVSIKHRQCRDTLLRGLHHGLQQRLPMAGQALDGRCFEQVAGIGQGRMQFAALLIGVQRQVKHRGAGLPLQWL
ncbi:hypothetical protein D3C72_1653110 [compost metagenome]